MHLIAYLNGGLLPEMKLLFEAFPDRFFVGTDTAHARVYRYYQSRANRWRFFFSQLTPRTARKIAFGCPRPHQACPARAAAASAFLKCSSVKL